MSNQFNKKSLIFIFVTMIFCAGISKAQTVPTVRIILPERFRALTHQYFDLRVEAENLSSPTARVVIDVDSGNKEGLNYAGQLEETSDNDANATNIDKAWTYRKTFFGTPGTKTIYAYVIDGRRIYGVATQISIRHGLSLGGLSEF